MSERCSSHMSQSILREEAAEQDSSEPDDGVDRLALAAGSATPLARSKIGDDGGDRDDHGESDQDRGELRRERQYGRRRLCKRATRSKS